MRVDTRTITLRDGTSVQLRSPDASDAAATLAFVRQLARESAENLNHPASFFEQLTVAGQAAYLSAIVGHRANFMISAWRDGAVIANVDLGVEMGSYASHVAQLGLGVLEASRGLGLGTILMECLIAQASAIGISNLLLRVRTSNDPAIRLYERLGFERVGTLSRVAALPSGMADEHVYQRAR